MASTGIFVDPGSVLARTAQEMVESHAGGAGPREGMMTCPVCGEPLPCPSGRAAAEVLFAAGLAESSGLVAAYRQGLGAAPASPFGLPPEADAPGPQAGASPFGAPGDSSAVLFDRPPHADPSAGGPAYTDSPSVDEAPGGLSGAASGPGAEDTGTAPPVAGSDANASWAGSDANASWAGSDANASLAGLDAAAPSAEPDTVIGWDAAEPADAVADRAAPSIDAPSRWAPRPAERTFEAEWAAGAPPPAETVRGIARPIWEPVEEPVVPELMVAQPAGPDHPPVPDVDPLLLGPPLFARQNRPLDAPRFTRTSPPAEPFPPAEPSPPAEPFPPQPRFLGGAGPTGAPQGAPAADPGEAVAGPEPSDQVRRQPQHPGEPVQPVQAAPPPPDHEPVAPGQEPATPDLEPATPDPEPATPDPEPASFGPEPASFGPEPASFGPEPASFDPGPAGRGPAGRADGPDHPGALDHPGEPGHPGVLDHPGEPRRFGPAGDPSRPPDNADASGAGGSARAGGPRQDARPGPVRPPSGRAPLEPPQMGQLNRGLPADVGKSSFELGRQDATVPQGRSHRPPLEAPQLGQLNRPLEPAGRSTEPGRPAPARDAPGRNAQAQEAPAPDAQAPDAHAPEAQARDARAQEQDPQAGQAQRPALLAPRAIGQDESGTPSGLLSPPAARPEPLTGQTPDEETPSGLPHRTDRP